MIIGTSGSGKTVLIKCMVGLFQPDAGEVLYAGNNFFDISNEQKKNIRKDEGGRETRETRNSEAEKRSLRKNKLKQES